MLNHAVLNPRGNKRCLLILLDDVAETAIQSCIFRSFFYVIGYLHRILDYCIKQGMTMIVGTVTKVFTFYHEW